MTCIHDPSNPSPYTQTHLKNPIQSIPTSLPNRPTPLILGQSHIRINRRTKHRKPRTSHRNRLGPRLARQNTARDTAAGDTVVEVVFGAQALDGAFGAGEDGADFGKVFAAGDGGAVHVAEAVFELGAEGEGG